MRGTRVGRGRAAVVEITKTVHDRLGSQLIYRHAGRLAVAVAALLLSVATVDAQPAGVQPGTIERDFEKSHPLKPTSDITIPSVEAPKAWGEAQSIRFRLENVDIDGNTVMTDSELRRPFERLIGKQVSINEVFAAAEQITGIYDAAGYALCLAYVPAQQIKGGTLLVRVVEGYIGDVAYTDAGGRRGTRWDGFAAKLKASKPLRTAELERYLLLANDTPGVRVKSMFERMQGGDPGAMRLVMAVERKTVDATLEVNNRGSKAIGPLRQSVNVAFNGLLGYDERLSVFGVTALENNELAYVGARADIPVGSEGTVFAIEAARSETDPGTAALTAIDYEGEGWTGSANVTFPVQRSLRKNIYVSGGLLYKDLKSRMLSTQNSHDRLTALAVSFDYDARDRSGSYWHALATLFVGLPVLDATEEGDPLASHLGASGEFMRLEATASRFQQLTAETSFYIEVAGQITDGPLLVSEQCGYGGAFFGRAFDPFEIVGDHCIKGRAEFRYDLPSMPFAAFQVYTMADFGIMVKAGTLLPGDRRTETGKSIGLGLRARAYEYLSGFAEVALPIDRGVAFENGSKDPRFFFGVSATY